MRAARSVVPDHSEPGGSTSARLGISGAMLAALLPDATQLSLVAATAVVAALCAGLGHWAGARRVETALLAGWGLAGLVTVVIGTLTSLPLTPVLVVLGLAGVTGVVHA